MNKIKNSFPLGILLGVVVSFILLVILDLIIFIIFQNTGKKNIEPDVCFALCTMSSLLLARKFFRMDEKQELGKGFLFAAFIWGAVYVYLFHVKHLTTIFFTA